MDPAYLPSTNSSSNGSQQGRHSIPTAALTLCILGSVIVLMLVICFVWAVCQCPVDRGEVEDIESNRGCVTARLQPCLEALDLAAPPKEFGQVKEEAKQRKPGEQPNWPDSYYACAICLDSMKRRQRVRRLLCGHVFHSSCIVPWYLRKHYFCPLCTLPFIPGEPQGSELTRPSLDAHQDHH